MGKRAKRQVMSEPMSPSQREYIETLLIQRAVPEDFPQKQLARDFWNQTLDRESASTLIDALKTLPRVFRGGRAAGRTADLPEVTAGQYIVPGAGACRVRHGQGQYDGWTYVEVRDRERGEYRPVTDVVTARRILEKIAQMEKPVCQAQNANPTPTPPGRLRGA